MVVTISSEVLAAIHAEAEQMHHREVCGLLFGEFDHVASHTSCWNVSASPADSFEIDPSALVAAHRAARAGGPRLVGYYHSHPKGAPTPSSRDATSAAPDGMLWLIVAGRGTGLYRATESGPLHDRFQAVAHTIVPSACAGS